MDKFTEMIAHFVGIFHTTLEKARARESYEEFHHLQAAPAKEPDLEQSRPAASAPHDLKDYHPNVRYASQAPEIEKIKVHGNMAFEPPEVPWPGMVHTLGLPGLPPAHGMIGSLPPGDEPAEIGPFRINPPGQIAVYAKQSSHLYDNDILSIGDHGLYMGANGDSILQLAEKSARVEEFASFRTDAVPGSGTEIAAFISGTSQRFKDFLEKHGSAENSNQDTSIQQAQVFVAKSLPATGLFVNGEEMSHFPLLQDHLPRSDAAKEVGGLLPPSLSHSTTSGLNHDASEPLVLGEAQSAGPGNVAAGVGKIGPVSKLEIDTGGNTTVNETFIYNGGLSAMALAVMGDVHHTTVVTQINAWWNQTLVSDNLSGWQKLEGGTTASYNIAEFQHVDPLASQTGAASGIFPAHWSVATVTGDLLFVNWIEQFNFMSDNDVATLASTGVKTSIIAGGNTQINATSIVELGYYYDLIFVGGSLYAGRFIDQLNILLDNDIIGTVDGFSTSGEGSVSTSGNLLWNQASITTVGGGGGFEAMPEHYLESFANLASGNMELADGVFADGIFTGLPHLNVLYVSGSIYDLQYIKQTNIVADSDTIALAKSAKADVDGDWSIATGGNALVNIAGIVDFEAFGKTYLAGSHYSDELLIQADLVSSDPDLGGRDPDVLINELVAFIDDVMPLTHNDNGTADKAVHIDSSQADVMQTMLA